jgi:hypothetical protein
MKQNCVVLEIENVDHFQSQLNKYLLDGYKIESSSCNGKYYRAILVLDLEETEKDVDANFVKKIENDTKTALLDAIEDNLLDIENNLMEDYHKADVISDAVIRATVKGVFESCLGGVHKFREEEL